MIFGERKYLDLSSEEQEIVDFYQDKKLEEDGGVVLPNTRADLEQIEFEKMLEELEKNKDDS